jgi:hypothetical protein
LHHQWQLQSVAAAAVDDFPAADKSAMVVFALWCVCVPIILLPQNAINLVI